MHASRTELHGTSHRATLQQCNFPSLSRSVILSLSLSIYLIAFASFATGLTRVEVGGGFCQIMMRPVDFQQHLQKNQRAFAVMALYRCHKPIHVPVSQDTYDQTIIRSYDYSTIRLYDYSNIRLYYYTAMIPLLLSRAKKNGRWWNNRFVSHHLASSIWPLASSM